MTASLQRAVDANLNRSCEGLRVVEDICRFMLDDKNLQQRLKTMRHELRSLVPAQACLGARDAAQDVGFASRGGREMERSDCRALLTANCKRIQEGLRSLEELFKLDAPSASAAAKAMRYAAYELERELWGRIGRRQLRRGLYLVLTEPPGGYETLTEMAVEAKLPAVQLRYKGDDVRRLLTLARNMREITRGSDTLFIVNDRPDVAIMVGADGVHVGQEDLPAAEVRRLVGPDMLLGLSTHNLDQVRAANDAPVDYIGFGPLYVTDSKEKPDPVVGPDMLDRAAREAHRPIVAIGGLDVARIRALDPCLYHNVAVIRAVTRADDPLAAMRAIDELTEKTT